MADFVTRDGKEINFDFERISIKEYRALFDKGQPQPEEDELMARVCGITVDELMAFSQPDYKKMLKAFLKVATSPLDDPS